MCINNYQFRHHTATKDKICRKFVIITEEDYRRCYFVNISQFEEKGQVALCKILLHLGTTGLTVEGKKFYMPKFKAIIKPESFCTCSFKALEDKELLFKTYPGDKDNCEIFEENEAGDGEKYERMKEKGEMDHCFCQMSPENEDVEQPGREQEANDDGGSSQVNQKHQADRETNENNEQIQKNKQNYMSLADQKDKEKNWCIFPFVRPIQYLSSFSPIILEEPVHDLNHEKKTKQFERSIINVIQIVKTWRNLHLSKLCNLTTAAKVLGISKKSLDDYFLILRIAEELNYDFETNLKNKMGHLRAFIKGSDRKVTGKLHKQVQCFKLVPDPDLQAVISGYKQRTDGDTEQANDNTKEDNEALQKKHGWQECKTSTDKSLFVSSRNIMPVHLIQTRHNRHDMQGS